MAEMRSLEMLVASGQYELAAYRLVYGWAKAKIDQKTRVKSQESRVNKNQNAKNQKAKPERGEIHRD